ncbi:hypothetical protein BC629DRAFT_1531529, partial [Irpex lacteus]
MVLTPEWLRTTVLVWVVWCDVVSVYNVQCVLPKLLEGRVIEDNLWDVVIYTVGDVPAPSFTTGSTVVLAGSTLLTSLFCCSYLGSTSIRCSGSTVGISLSATVSFLLTKLPS